MILLSHGLTADSAVGLREIAGVTGKLLGNVGGCGKFEFGEEEFPEDMKVDHAAAGFGVNPIGSCPPECTVEPGCFVGDGVGKDTFVRGGSIFGMFLDVPASDEPGTQCVGCFSADEYGTGGFIFGDGSRNINFYRICGKREVVKGDTEQFADPHSRGDGDEYFCTLPYVCVMEDGLNGIPGKFGFPGDGAVFRSGFFETPLLVVIGFYAAFPEVHEDDLCVEVDGFGCKRGCPNAAFFRESYQVCCDGFGFGEIGCPEKIKGMVGDRFSKSERQIALQCCFVGLSGCFPGVITQKFRWEEHSLSYCIHAI